MANINPRGIDLTTGQLRTVTPSDILTDSLGAALNGAFTVLNAQQQNLASTISYVLPGGTLANDGDTLFYLGFGTTNSTWGITPTFGGTQWGVGAFIISNATQVFWGYIQRAGVSSQRLAHMSHTGGTGITLAKNLSLDQTMLFTRSGVDPLNGLVSLNVYKLAA